MEIGLAPECVHTDPREKRYYLMKRFVRAAVKYAERVQKTTVKIVAFLYETPFNSVVMVNGESTFNDVSDIFCTPEFTNDERRESRFAWLPAHFSPGISSNNILN